MKPSNLSSHGRIITPQGEYGIVASYNSYVSNNKIIGAKIISTGAGISALDNSMAKMIMETINNMLIELYATMAQAEIEKKEKRQQEGIAAKKSRGEWADYGRPKAQKPDNWNAVVEQWKKGEITAVKAMEITNTKKTTFYKFLKEEAARE